MEYVDTEMKPGLELSQIENELHKAVGMLQTRFDIINIDVHAVIDATDEYTKPCSWQYWRESYMELVEDLKKAGIVKEKEV